MTRKAVLDTCVYTIVHSNQLDDTYNKGGKGKFTEGKQWPTAKKLLLQAQRNNMDMLVIFAPAEATNNLVYHAKLTSITINEEKQTTYTFEDLTPFKKPLPQKMSLILASTGKQLHIDFIRPYALCKTPDTLMGKST